MQRWRRDADIDAAALFTRWRLMPLRYIAYAMLRVILYAAAVFAAAASLQDAAVITRRYAPC